MSASAGSRPFAAACALSSPFIGPGIVEGEVATTHPGPFVVAATHARPASGQGAAFQQHVSAIQGALDVMEEADGLLGYSLRGEIGGNDNWTATVWTSEEAMLDFVLGDVHAAAMADAGTVLEQATFTHWEEADPDALPPRWDDLLDALADAGATY